MPGRNCRCYGLACSESERRMLATILLKEDEELTAERLEGAVRALRRFTCAGAWNKFSAN